MTDAYEKHAVSALSSAILGRNTFGAFLPPASQSLFNDLGFQWAGSLLGFVGLALSVALSMAPLVILWKSEEIRRRRRGSTFMHKVTQEKERKKSSFGA